MRGVPKDIPIDEVKEDLLSQHLLVQSIRRIQNRFREPHDLVLVSGTAEANDKMTKAAFFKSGAYVSSPALKRCIPTNAPYPGSAITATQCTHNKDTDGPPACVLCKQKGHTANYLGCPRAPKRAHPPEKVAPRLDAARARCLINAKLRLRSEGTMQRPAHCCDDESCLRTPENDAAVRVFSYDRTFQRWRAQTNLCLQTVVMMDRVFEHQKTMQP
ncbi:hypothetical protein EVAR_79883_1 [Eumeta japonica]|uniref:Nucleic-acid-binding protein from transposon X-element n=1 Tax=Eumeta variegata TaxID=151549 RepID=A0A4C1TYY4_EUMVA|nr:hypothetical protein EVAR_79883_1 [Eumeta japonica]